MFSLTVLVSQFSPLLHTVELLYVTKNAPVATFCCSGFLYTKMFDCMCMFQKWFMPFFLLTLKVKLKGQRSRL